MSQYYTPFRAGVSTDGNTDGTTGTVLGQQVLVGGANITLSQGISGQQGTITIIGGAGGTGAGAGIALSAGTQLATTNTVVFSNSNGISFGMSGSSRVTASYTVPSVAGLLSNVNISAGTTSNNLSNLVYANSNGISFGLDGSTLTATVQTNYLTTAMASNRGSDFVQATAAFAGTSASGTIASSGISVSVGPYITTAMASNRGSDFVQATAAFAGTNASGTIASNGISVSVDPPGGGGLTNIRVSAGTTSNLLSALTIADSNGISFGLNAGTLTATVKTDYLTSQSNQAASASNGSFTFQTLGFSNANNVTFGTSAGSIVTASVAAAGGGATLSHFWVPDRPLAPAAVLTNFAQSVIWLCPLRIENNAIVSAFDFFGSVSVSSSSDSSHAGALSLFGALYTVNASTLSMATSGSQSYQWTNTSNNSQSILSAGRLFSAPIAATLTPGDYWAVVMMQSATTNANWFTLQPVVYPAVNLPLQGHFMSAATASVQHALGFGSLSFSSAALPASIGFSDLRGTVQGNLRVPNLYFYNSTV